MNTQKKLKDLELTGMFEEYFSYCEHCQTKRERIEFKDLPKETQKEFASSLGMEQFKDAIFYYCSNCEEYSLQGKPVFG